MIISGDEIETGITMFFQPSGWDLSLILCPPHSEDHTQTLLFTTSLQLIPTTTNFALGLVIQEIYLCTLYVYIVASNTLTGK